MCQGNYAWYGIRSLFGVRFSRLGPNTKLTKDCRQTHKAAHQFIGYVSQAFGHTSCSSW